MPVPAEPIPDIDPLHRQVDFPSMYDGAGNLIWDNVFQFSGGSYESVVWAKYASSADRVHELGRAREALKRQTKPEMRYVGFISSTAGKIRGVRTAAGHSFSVCHKPDEGAWHAGICYRPSGGRFARLNRGEKNELKLALRLIFGALVPCSSP